MPRTLRPPSLGHWPLRVRLTAAFAAVVALVLLATGVVVYVQFARALDARTDEELAERQSALRGLAAGGTPPERLLALSGEPFAQVYDARGATLASARRVGSGRLLTAAEVAGARSGERLIDANRVPGTDDGARVRGFPIAGERVAAIAEPRDGREVELRGLAILLAVALPGALLLASLAGYQVAGAALRPVERIRARAAAIGDTDLDQRLPRPGTHDELDRLTATLNDLLDRLAGALERERRIVGDASHELRTPISVLRTRLDVAVRGDLDPQRLRAALEAARGDADRLSRLADDLLVLARADQGRLPLRLEPTDVQDLLEQAADRHGAEGTPIEVRIAIEGGAAVLVDPDRIGQALDNLVVNALRHGREPVELRARLVDARTVGLSVRDRGPGSRRSTSRERSSASARAAPHPGTAAAGSASRSSPRWCERTAGPSPPPTIPAAARSPSSSSPPPEALSFRAGDSRHRGRSRASRGRTGGRSSRAGSGRRPRSGSSGSRNPSPTRLRAVAGE